jgi:2,3,4,5-tetrahydropyridine-2,6-dicarboxylate N-succinyltransferase
MHEIFNITDPYEIAKYIKNSKKATPVQILIEGELEEVKSQIEEGLMIFGSLNFWVIVGDYNIAMSFIEKQKNLIQNFYIEYDRRNSAIPLLDITGLNARIEPGAIIREGVLIGDQAVVLMGAVVNIGAQIGERSMIDMNAVVGARVVIGKDVHIGAGAVIAGVLEPPSATPVIVEDNVLIGANAVVLEGVRIGHHSVVAAGSVVTTDVPPNSVAAGSPARIVKSMDDQTRSKTKQLEDLR